MPKKKKKVPGTRLNPRFLLLLFLIEFGCLHPSDPRPGLVIRNASGQDISVRVEIADTDLKRERGLMFRKNLPKGEGMLFLFPSETRASFWMRNTPIPLDMIFIRDHHIVEIFPNAIPFSEALITPSVNYDSVLEVPGGYASGERLGKGDLMQYAGGGNSPWL